MRGPDCSVGNAYHEGSVLRRKHDPIGGFKSGDSGFASRVSGPPARAKFSRKRRFQGAYFGHG